MSKIMESIRVTGLRAEIRKYIFRTVKEEECYSYVHSRVIISLQFFKVGYNLFLGSQDNTVDIGTVYGLDDGNVGVRVPVEARIFISPCHPDRVQPTSYPMGTGGSFPGGIAARA
jgi:hypothetical protein